MNNEYNDDRDVKIFSGDSDANKAPEDSGASHGLQQFLPAKDRA